MPQRRIQVMNQPAEEDNGEADDLGLVTDASIGLAGGRAMRTRPPLVIKIYVCYEYWSAFLAFNMLS